LPGLKEPEVHLCLSPTADGHCANADCYMEHSVDVSTAEWHTVKLDKRAGRASAAAAAAAAAVDGGGGGGGGGRNFTPGGATHRHQACLMDVVLPASALQTSPTPLLHVRVTGVGGIDGGGSIL
jgi:hypothetical protein